MVLIGLNAITKELVLACRQLGLVVSETLAAFVASTIVNPADGAFYVEKNLEENEARSVVEESVKRLFGTGKPQVESLKLQASYETAFFEIERKSQAERKQRADAEERIVDQIVGASAARLEDFDSMSQLYRRIYQLLLLRCGSPAGGPPKKGAGKDPGVEREVAASLESVFPRVGLRSFVALTGPEKTAQLQELCNIVLGIRLFNKRLGKGGAGLPAIKEDEENSESNDKGGGSTATIEQTLQLLETEIGECHAACRLYSDHIMLLAEAKKEGTKEHDLALEELYYRRQHLAYLLSLQDDMTGAVERRANDIQTYDNELLELDALVGARSSVPKDQVYPRFDTVARIYLAASQETRLLRERQQLCELLTKQKQIYQPRLAEEKAREAQARRTAGHFDEVPAPETAPGPPPDQSGDSEGPQKLTLENTPDFLQLPLDFQGFCVAALSNQGILTPGNPALGVTKYKGRYCVFASEASLQAFMLNPEKYFVGVREACYRCPCLIHLLRLHEDFPKSSLIGIIQGQEGRAGLSGAVVQADASTETPKHFIESNIDKSYEWNEWAMRRDALHLADIRQKKTSSTQTLLSSLRRESETQVFLPKDAATNTGVSQGTNPERWRTYVTGLRGDPNVQMKTVNLKFEL